MRGALKEGGVGDPDVGQEEGSPSLGYFEIAPPSVPIARPLTSNYHVP